MAVVYGDVGTGKTTILNKLRERFGDEGFTIAVMNNPNQTNTIWVMVISRRMSNKAISVYAEALKREQEEEEKYQASRKTTSKITRKSTRIREPSPEFVS